MQPNDDNTLINGVGFAVSVINKVWTFLRRVCEKCLPEAKAFVHSKAIKTTMDRHSLASRSVQQINQPALTVSRAGEITLFWSALFFFAAS